MMTISDDQMSRVEDDGTRLVAQPTTTGCAGCHFDLPAGCNSVRSAERVCSPAARTDREHIIWVRAEDAPPKAAAPAESAIDVERLRALLDEAGSVFRSYEELHRARGPEHASKADKNAEIAGRIEAALAGAEPKPSAQSAAEVFIDRIDIVLDGDTVARVKANDQYTATVKFKTLLNAEMWDRASPAIRTALQKMIGGDKKTENDGLGLWL